MLLKTKSHVPSTGVVSRKILALNALSLETVCKFLKQELNVPAAGVYVPASVGGERERLTAQAIKFTSRPQFFINACTACVSCVLSHPTNVLRIACTTYSLSFKLF